MSEQESAFVARALELLARHADRSGYPSQGPGGSHPRGTIEGLALVLKRAAIEAGVPGADQIRPIPSTDPKIAAQLVHDVDEAAAAVQAAEVRVQAVWRRWGYPEAHRAAGHLAAAGEALSDPGAMPPA